MVGSRTHREGRARERASEPKLGHLPSTAEKEKEGGGALGKPTTADSAKAGARLGRDIGDRGRQAHEDRAWTAGAAQRETAGGDGVEAMAALTAYTTRICVLCSGGKEKGEQRNRVRPRQ